MADLGGDGVAFQAAKDFEAEGDRVAGGTPGHDTAGPHGGRGRMDGALGNQQIFEPIKTSELSPLQHLGSELAEHQPRRSANRCHGAAGGIMSPHGVDERRAGGEVLGPGHAARENHYIIDRRSGCIQVHFRQVRVGADRDPVGRLDGCLVGQGDQARGDAAPAEHVAGGEGLDILEAVGQKDIHSFHIHKISKNPMNLEKDNYL